METSKRLRCFAQLQIGCLSEIIPITQAPHPEHTLGSWGVETGAGEVENNRTLSGTPGSVVRDRAVKVSYIAASLSILTAQTSVHRLSLSDIYPLCHSGFVTFVGRLAKESKALCGTSETQTQIYVMFTHRARMFWERIQ